MIEVENVETTDVLIFWSREDADTDGDEKDSVGDVLLASLEAKGWKELLKTNPRVTCSEDEERKKTTPG